MEANRELLIGVSAVLRGEQFVGSRFASHDFTEASDAEGLPTPPEAIVLSHHFSKTRIARRRETLRKVCQGSRDTPWVFPPHEESPCKRHVESHCTDIDEGIQLDSGTCALEGASGQWTIVDKTPLAKELELLLGAVRAIVLSRLLTLILPMYAVEMSWGSDMTERIQIEEALKKCEEKFLRAFRESPLSLSLTSAKDHRYIEVNETFERISGWSRNELIGRTPFDIKIWVDPSQRIDIVKRLLSEGTVRDFQVLARMRNQEVRTILIDAALVEIDGETCVLGLCADVTDLKRAEEAKQAELALSRMARRLIEAQEAERSGIARELHEYVERLTLLSVGMGHLRQDTSESVPEFSQQIEKARQEIEDLVIDIQTLSQRLHSSKLEYLGLAAAARNYCKEFSEQKKIEIDFAPENITEQIPQEVSLCLFRVLQEALQIAVNDSGSQRLRVLLGGGSNEIYLTVRNSGIGFDMENAPEALGLGLAIIKERLKLVDGELSIESQRGSGTTIHARVPLNITSERAEVAG